MITITQGQSPKDHPELQVLSPSGDYDENDLIVCAKVGESEPYCQYEAQYVANGHTAYDEGQIPT